MYLYIYHIYIYVYRYLDSVYDILIIPHQPQFCQALERGHVLPDAHDPQGSYCVAWSVFRMLKNMGDSTNNSFWRDITGLPNLVI